jgi:hypothetical protein
LCCVTVITPVNIKYNKYAPVSVTSTSSIYTVCVLLLLVSSSLWLAFVLVLVVSEWRLCLKQTEGGLTWHNFTFIACHVYSSLASLY